MKKIINTIQQWLASIKKNKNSTKADPNEKYKSTKVLPTPNPQAYQFLVDRSVIHQGSICYDSADEAEDDPFAKSIFDIFGIETLFIKENFVTITKSPTVSWDFIVPRIKEIIETRLMLYKTQKQRTTHNKNNKFKEFTAKEFLQFPSEEKERIIDVILDCAVRPSLARDGGDLYLIGVQGNVIEIRFQGACGQCPSSTRGTLQFIEDMIKENLHPDLKVKAL